MSRDSGNPLARAWVVKLGVIRRAVARIAAIPTGRGNRLDKRKPQKVEPRGRNRTNSFVHLLTWLKRVLKSRRDVGPIWKL